MISKGSPGCGRRGQQPAPTQRAEDKGATTPPGAETVMPDKAASDTPGHTFRRLPPGGATGQALWQRRPTLGPGTEAGRAVTRGSPAHPLGGPQGRPSLLGAAGPQRPPLPPRTQCPLRPVAAEVRLAPSLHPGLSRHNLKDTKWP